MIPRCFTECPDLQEGKIRAAKICGLATNDITPLHVYLFQFCYHLFPGQESNWPSWPFCSKLQFANQPSEAPFSGQVFTLVLINCVISWKVSSWHDLLPTYQRRWVASDTLRRGQRAVCQSLSDVE